MTSTLHLDRTILGRFLGGHLSERESHDLQRHLFVCPDCEERLLALLPGSPSLLPFSRREDHHRLIRRLVEGCRAEADAFRRRLAGERAAAPRLWREIEPHGEERRRALVRSDPRFATWGFHELLLDRSRRAALEDVQRAEHLLRLAFDVARRLDREGHGPGAVEAAKGRTWASLGNVLRVRGDFRRAEGAFRNAERHLSRSWLDPLDEALLLELKAPLRRAQRRFGEALELLEGALAIYREVNDPHLQGRVLMTKGVVLQYMGNPQEAAACFRRCLFLLDSLREPRLVGMSQYNLISCLQDAGQSAEAAALIPEARRMMEQVGTRFDLWRLRWTEGRVAASLGRHEEAEEALGEVREAFLDSALAFDAALVSLDLALVYLRQHRAGETRRLAAEMIPVFQSREVHREALGALIVFQRAAELEELTAGLVEEIAAYLRQARVDPRLRFREGEAKGRPGDGAAPPVKDS
ncbi:MAG: tetratricopeptide repeat protein [Thermoanaerobaculia bacterium]